MDENNLTDYYFTASASASNNLTYLIQSTTKQAQQQNQQPSVPFYTIVISLIIYSLIFAIGFFGNAIVIFVVCCNKSLQHNTNYCLVNLSVADLLLITVCMPSAIVDLFAKEVWYFGYLLCKIIPWLEYSIAHASVLTIVAISVERSMAISTPLLAKQIFTSKRLCIVVILIWIISTLSSIPIMTSTFYTEAYHKTMEKYVSICFTSTQKRWDLAYLFLSLILFYLLPCILLFIQYSRIVFTIKNRKYASVRLDSTANKHHQRIEKISIDHRSEKHKH